MVKRNEFRSDLYYRLNVFPVPLPPLRARREDIPALVEHFVEIYARRMGKQIDRISPETMSELTSYPWPGNIRELQNFIERSVILTSGNTLDSPLAEISRASGAAWQVSASVESASKAPARGRLKHSGWVAPVSVGAASNQQGKKSPLYFVAKPGF
jgi:formate hydrogenlyase transcriptional activator